MKEFTLVRCAILAAIFACVLWLRLHRLDAQSLSFDETWHLELSTGRGTHHELLPVGQVLREEKVTSFAAAPQGPFVVWTSFERVTHPPLFASILRLWRLAFGESDWAGRALPAITSALAVLALFDVARLLHGWRVGLWASAIMAVAPAQITSAQDLRGYPQLLLLSLLTADAAVRMVKLGPTWRRSASLSGGFVAMMLTHYFAIGMCLAIGAYLMLARREVRNRALVAIATAALIYAACWGPFLLRQIPAFKDAGETWLQDTNPDAKLRTLMRLAVTPARLFFEPLGSSYPLAYAAAIVFVVMPLALRRQPELLLWVLWLAGSVGFIWMLDVTRSTLHLEFVRYWIHAGPAVYVFVAAIALKTSRVGRNWVNHILPAGVAAACLASLHSAYEPFITALRDLHFRPQWREIGRTLDGFAKPDEMIVILKTGPAEGIPAHVWAANYLCISHTSATFPRPFFIVNTRPDEKMLAELRRVASPTAIVVTNVPNVTELLPGTVLVQTKFFPYTPSLARIRWANAEEISPTTESSPTTAPSR